MPSPPHLFGLRPSSHTSMPAGLSQRCSCLACVAAATPERLPAAAWPGLLQIIKNYIPAFDYYEAPPLVEAASLMTQRAGHAVYASGVWPANSRPQTAPIGAGRPGPTQKSKAVRIAEAPGSDRPPDWYGYESLRGSGTGESVGGRAGAEGRLQLHAEAALQRAGPRVSVTCPVPIFDSPHDPLHSLVEQHWQAQHESMRASMSYVHHGRKPGSSGRSRPSSASATARSTQRRPSSAAAGGVSVNLLAGGPSHNTLVRYDDTKITFLRPVPQPQGKNPKAGTRKP